LRNRDNAGLLAGADEIAFVNKPKPDAARDRGFDGRIVELRPRGVDRRWVRELYSFAVKPDLAVYFRVPIDTSVDRLMARRVKLKFYEAGMDLGWSTVPLESFRLFQGKVLDEYDRLVDEFGLEVVNAVGSITEQQRIVRNLITPHLQRAKVEVGDEQPV